MKLSEIIKKQKELSLKDFNLYLNEELKSMKKKDKKLLRVLLMVMFSNTIDKRYIVSINF